MIAAEMGYMNLPTLWFGLIAVLWVGYFFLEGFDFGVGMLMPILGKHENDRRLMVRTIGPLWDGNEVWLLVAGGATFAAFPEWYATLFSGFYLPLFFILVAIIVRGVAFEYRAKHTGTQWRAWADRAIIFGSFVPALLWGVAFANIVRGVPLDADYNYVGGFFNLLNPYALLGGVTWVMLFLTHGATFLTLKSDGEFRQRSLKLARQLSWPTTACVVGFLVWTYFNAKNNEHDGLVPGFIPVAAMIAIATTEWLLKEKMEGWAFVSTGLTIALLTTTIFLNLYPRVMPSSVDPLINSLTIWNASSTGYTLRVMSVVALTATPIVLAYQAWSYWVFRKRLDLSQVGDDAKENKYSKPRH